MSFDRDQVIAQIQAWLQHAVIGLNLCPFAKAVHFKNQIRYAVSDARDEVMLLDDLHQEVQRLIDTPISEIETTLLIHPHVLSDFGDFNDFLDMAEGLVDAMGQQGVLQIASFHPHYQFAGTATDDISNATNQSPYPMLHLLREESVSRAAAAFPQAEAIYEANVRTMEKLGVEGWAALQQRWKCN